MWPLLFLLLVLPMPAEASVESWTGDRPVAVEVSHADDGAEWVADTRTVPRVRRRRAKRMQRRVERRFATRTLRPRRGEEQRRVASEVSLRLQRASAVARRVARTTRRSHLPVRAGSSDAAPPAL